MNRLEPMKALIYCRMKGQEEQGRELECGPGAGQLRRASQLEGKVGCQEVL